MSTITRVNIQDMYRVIESDYVPVFNPFKEYLNSLPQITQTSTDNVSDEPGSCKPIVSQQQNLCKSVKSVGVQDKKQSVGDRDYIRELAQTVRVKGGEQEQMLWHLYLKKWLVGMVASWISDDVVNSISPIQRPHYITSSYTYQFFEKNIFCIVLRVKDC